MLVFQTNINSFTQTKESQTTTQIYIECMANDAHLKLIVTDFLPYFYVKIKTDKNDILNFFMSKNVDVVSHKLSTKKNVYGYISKNESFLKVFFKNIVVESAARRACENMYEIFDANIPFNLQFMVDMGIVGMSYLEIDMDMESGQELRIEDAGGANGVFSTSLDVHNGNQRIKRHKLENEENTKCIDAICNTHRIGRVYYVSHRAIRPVLKDNMPVFKVLSFDLEVNNRENKFPDSSIDEIIQIGNTVKQHEYKQTIFCQRSTAGIAGVDVRSYDTEREMIEEWIKFVYYEDPDVLLGYNISGFDFDYIIGRVRKLGVPFCLCRLYIDPSKDDTIARAIDTSARMLRDVAENETNLKLERKMGQVLKNETSAVLETGKMGREEMNRTANNVLSEIESKKGRLATEHVMYDAIKDKFGECKSCNNTRKEMFNDFHGRVVVDMLTVIKKEHKLRSYTLNNVSVHFLGMQKEDLPYYLIKGLFDGDDKTRRRIAVYCLKDTLLPLLIYEKLLIFITGVEMVRVLGVPIHWHFNRGISVKIFGLILREARKNGFVIPNVTVKDEGYMGAFVIEPERGYYDEPIAVLDFASLYPSIIIAHNLCYSTMLLGTKHGIDKSKDAEISPTGTYFVKKDVRVGLLPVILEKMLKKRKEVKEQMKNETNAFMRTLLNARQNAFKVSANSVYGFTGSAVSRLPCIDISQSVTGYGREMIIKTKNVVESVFCRDKGYDFDGRVIYGDTDSVMVRIRKENLSVDYVFEIAKEMANKVSECFVKPVKLEFEKVYFPYLLMNKKRYAGVIETREEIKDEVKVSEVKSDSGKSSSQTSQAKEARDNSDNKTESNEIGEVKIVKLKDETAVANNLKNEAPNTTTDEKGTAINTVNTENEHEVAKEPNKKYKIKRRMDTKGIETVRRDNCKLVKSLIEECLNLLLIQSDPERAKLFVKAVVRDLYLDRIDLGQLVISKTLSKTNYAAKQAHVELAERMKKRDNAVISIGDRIAYVIVDKGPNVIAYEKSEDPLYVLEKNLPVDVNYYIEQQIMKPVHRLFDPLMDNVNELFVGEHTATRKKGTLSGPMAQFVKKGITCLLCKERGSILCKRCAPNYFSVYVGKIQEMKEKEDVYNKCWRECQRCIRSVCTEVLCANKDCPIFFMRSKVIREIGELDDQIKQLNSLEW